MGGNQSGVIRICILREATTIECLTSTIHDVKLNLFVFRSLAIVWQIEN